MDDETRRDPILEFLGYAHREHNLSPLTEAGVWVEPVIHNGVQIAILIDEETTVDAIKNSWWQIRNWRDALREWKGGAWRHAGPQHEFYRWLSWRVGGRVGYATAAGQVRQRIVKLLTEYAEYLKEFYAIKPQLEAAGYMEAELLRDGMPATHWEKVKNNPFSFEHADDILRLCKPKMGAEERRQWLLMGLKNIQAGRKPFPPDEPISGPDIRERVRYWRRTNPGWDDPEGWNK